MSFNSGKVNWDPLHKARILKDDTLNDKVNLAEEGKNSPIMGEAAIFKDTCIRILQFIFFNELSDYKSPININPHPHCGKTAYQRQIS